MTEADLAKLGREELAALVLEQAAAIERQTALIAALQAKVEELTRSAELPLAPRPAACPAALDGRHRKDLRRSVS